MTLPEIKISTLRETQCELSVGDTPEMIAKAWVECIPDASWFDPMKECFVVWLLDTRRKIMGYSLVSIGTLDQVVVHAREVFRPAVVQSASAVVITHNHPSGDPKPSEADIKVTRDLKRAGKILRIELLDSIIIGRQGENNSPEFYSLREQGYFYE